MAHSEQGSGNPVYVRREKSNFKPGWSLSAGFRVLLSLQIIDCLQQPVNTPSSGNRLWVGCRQLPCRSWGHAKGGKQIKSGLWQLFSTESIRPLMTHISLEAVLGLCAFW